MLGHRSSSGLAFGLCLGLALLVPTSGHAQTQLHGAFIDKACVGPLIVDPLGLGRARRGDVITCTLGVTNVDDFGDSLRVDTITDTIDHAGGPVTTPNLLPGGMSTILPTLDDFIQVQHTDVVLPDDPNPLVDHAASAGVDLGFTPPRPFSLTFATAVTIVDCVTAAECDDQNLCTVDTCVDDFCVHTPGNAGTVCRSATGACDVPETCTGTSPTCPPDGLASSSTVCRSSTGECDLPESCPGDSSACPPDVTAPDGTPCTDTDGLDCTIPECSGGTCNQTAVSNCVTHFQCFEVKPAAFPGVPNVSLVYRYGSSVVNVQRPAGLCTAADKNGEDPGAPSLPNRLTAYKIAHPFSRVNAQHVVTQFGTVVVDLTRPDRLLVPTDATLPPKARVVEPSGPSHFQCYKAVRSSGKPAAPPVPNVHVEDPFGMVTAYLRRPSRLCVPVNKNDEAPDAPGSPDDLLCYRSTFNPGFADAKVPATNQFGAQTLELIRRIDFCVPAHLDTAP